ncbi:MAG: hypothetical protein IKJ30_04285 [Bacilli bacterium]|nr:hypothetical protein [Bacilli bacterium]
MKNKLFYLGKINIAKVLVLGCIFIMSLFCGEVAKAAPSVTILSSTSKGNVTGDNAYDAKTINGISYIQGTGISDKDGIKFELTNAYEDIDDYTAIAIWEQGFSSSAGVDFQDYDRWYIDTIACPNEDYANCALQLDTSADKDYIAKDASDHFITYGANKLVYYVVESQNNKDSADVVTVADFTNFFTSKKIIYTYRIRNLKSANTLLPSFGFKEIYVNFWRASGEEAVDDSSASMTIKYGLAQPINFVDTHTNYTHPDYDDDNPVVCSNHADYICIDYEDSNGIPSESTTREELVNIYVPNTVIYTHAATTSNSIKDSYKDADGVKASVKAANTVYGINYFCEGSGIVPATINNPGDGYSVSCGTDALREYLYVDSELIGSDIRSVTTFTNGQTYFATSTYQMTLTVDSRGNYVVFIRDTFGNVNSKAIINVDDIINQALLAYFQKSNAKEDVRDVNGWFAEEFVTNSDVYVSITMSATTVIKVGLPIVPAETTLLDSEYVKEVRYWRVDGSLYDSDICVEDVGNGCAIKPSDDDSTQLYYRANTSTDPVPGTDWESFVGNVMTMRIHSNGRYRFYIETFAGNNTDNDGTSPVTGEQKNPRVEIYKMDKNAPEIKFGGKDDLNCSGATCKYEENTFPYYQGTGSTKGSVINKLVNGSEGSIQINYSKNSIYYVSANGGNSILASASDADIFFTYLMALTNSGTYISENLYMYDGDTEEYSYSTATAGGVTYTLVDNPGLSSMSEEAYRKYIISNDIKYTAYSLATNSDMTIVIDGNVYDLQQSNIKIEYIDHSDGTTPVCEKLSSLKVDLNADNVIDQTDCVNYYLDHGIDFDIKVTAYDVVEERLKDENGNEVKDAEGKYTIINVMGNVQTRTIHVDVVDDTAPGFNSIINNYNVGTDCRVELGNLIGGSADQDMDMIMDCYAISTTTNATPAVTTYNFEDNVFASSFTQIQDANVRSNVKMYILSKETHKWVSLDDGYVPNRSGKYAVLVVISDNASTNTVFDLSGNSYHEEMVDNESSITIAGNAIGVLVSYHVDKKIVLINPNNNEKDYGEEDPIFSYCVWVNKNTVGIKEYLEAPFTDMTVFTRVGCAEYNADKSAVSLTEAQLRDLFQGNYGIANFDGILTRQESGIYNDEQFNNTNNIINNYVGLYKIVLGTLTISGTDADGDDLGEDYIVKIDPNNRSEDPQLAKQAGKCNLVDSQLTSSNALVNRNETDYADCYAFDEDDDFFVESKAMFTIKQVVLTVSANGSFKEYGTVDPNYDNSNKNTTNEKITASASAYLNGYSIVSGLQYSDTIGVILGVLRRQTGEDVGLYSICNYRGTSYNGSALTDTILEDPNDMLIVGGGVAYTSCATFDPYADVSVRVTSYLDGIRVIDDAYISSRALYIETNKQYEYYKTLNTTTELRNNNYANYVIEYQANTFSINPASMVVQPTPGQRREYSYSGVDEINPWEIVVYGEKTFAKSDNAAFNGYTANSATYAVVSENDRKSVDTIDANLDEEHYNNASEVRDAGWTLIRDNKTYTGFKTNETYSMFTGRLALVSGDYTLNSSLGVYQNMNAGWYAFDVLDEDKSTLELLGNGRNQCAYADYVSITGTTYSSECRNYNLVLDLEYRTLDGYKNGDKDADNNDVVVVYRSKLGYCKTTALGAVSDAEVQCSDDISSQILFEVYRREIILEFNSLLEKIPSNDAHMVYGYRYDYYETNLFEITSTSANKNHLENYLFYCYPSYEDGLVGTVSNPSNTCTGNPWYGLTENDTWVNIGLEFHLHSVVSNEASSIYYTSGVDYAIPAGRYYVYSTISNTAKQNYKYNYLGGTLTIKTKTVGIELTDYSKEYGNVYYTNENCKIKDGSLLSGANSLIDDCLATGDEATSNTANNTYGFVINELDSKDTIADNFIGRPKRESNLDASYVDVNGLQENVGIYEIDDGTIISKHNNTLNSTCTDNFVGDEAAGCVVVGGDDYKINNYMVNNDADYELTYYLLKNGTVDNSKDYSSSATLTIVNPGNATVDKASLVITPASITIEVTEGQTKMYGCAYNGLNTVSSYSYTYADGYSNCEVGTGLNYDLGYAYTVIGDKDYYIYNYGYYDDDYSYEDITYTSNGINQVIKGESNVTLDDSLLIAAPMRKGSRSTALNAGVLYRVENSIYNNSISYASIVAAANAAQAENAAYQGQSVGTYTITLGNLNAALTSLYSNYKEENNKVCNASNVPGSGNSEVCRNYIINYYGSTSVEETHVYDSEDKDDLTFTITTRVAFIYALYNSKVYGNAEPVETLTCDEDMIDAGICDNVGDVITLGVTEYYTKYNSLAKAPYVASIETAGNISFEYDATVTTNDKQTDVVVGESSRKGMNNGDRDIDDIVGVYNFIFDDVNTTTYSQNNYVLNFYYRRTVSDAISIVDGVIDEDTNPYILDATSYNQYMAVNENGTTVEIVDSQEKRVYFEINLRKIYVKLINFSKVYGIEDDRSYFDLAICATGDEVIGYDSKGNATCSFAEGVTFTEHGLTPSHKNDYMVDGVLNQEKFKDDFYVTFIRALGENTTCPSQNVTGTIHGHFTEGATTYSYDLGCKNYPDDITGYEALGIINQSSNSLPGYNYEVTYEEGDMIILPRTIKITPDSGQGFQYGSYTYPSLIPAITFTNALENASYSDTTRKVITYNVGATTLVRIVNRDGTSEATTITTNELGLVNAGDTRICLNNIDGNNKFCINDRQDTYDVDKTEKTTSSYVENVSGSDSEFTTYVFGDVYNDEDSRRSALDRIIVNNDSQRYNRNVGVYTIVKGDITDHSGNYYIEFNDTAVTYSITPATLNINPDANQSKTYGEADKELTFTLTTKYVVNSTQYVMYNDSIVSIKDVDGNDVSIDRTAEKILVTKGSEILLSGYAYYENMEGDYNYGVIKNSNKKENSVSLPQVEVEGMSYDKYCYDNYNGGAAGAAINNCDGATRKVSYETTTLVLVGYLYVTDYVQKAGTYKIANGFVVSDNEFDKKNYNLTFNDDVDFVISKLDINIHLKDVTKEYGKATDNYKCDIGVICETGYMSAQDHENMLEYNFDISYKDSADIIAAGTYDGESMVLMVNAINDNYYTQSEGREDKNNYLGISVVRKNNNDSACSVSDDVYGCEDAGEYNLAIKKYDVILTEKDGSTRYDDNYNLMVENVATETQEITNKDDGAYVYISVNPSSHEVEDIDTIVLIKNLTKKLTITQRTVDIFVNTNVNSTEANYFEIEQNIEVPTLPTVDNSYNLTGYTYDPDGIYHGVGEDASSKSSSANLPNTYGTIVWGGQPSQVRTLDALVGAVAYCNEARNGDNYADRYPTVGTLCTGTGALVYNDEKATVNTATKDKFILITRDTANSKGLKIRPNTTGAAVEGNEYEVKNYVVNFYPGAVHVVGDDKAPIVVVGNTDYYIEANAFYDAATGNIIGSYTGVDTILEYLANGDTTEYIMANVDENGKLYISLPTKDLAITQSSLQSTYGVSSDGYQGIVSGIEQALVYPFTSNYAHMSEAKADSKEGSYLNETNITMLEELITTFIKWFDIDAYDSGQYINGEYLQRRFDKYYYIAINKHGYDIAGDIDNEFAINKVGTYDVSIYVMDNAGRVSKDGNIARLHIIDTTSPTLGTLNLYSAPVKCDSNCDAQDSWYIDAPKVKLASFNKYKQVDDGEGNFTYVLDPEGEYIYYTEIGNDSAPYKLISDLTLTTIDYVDYVDTSSTKFMAYGVMHHTWASSESGIYLTITGGSDNSFTVEDDTQQSQWRHYYSLDGGSYWSDYLVTAGMSGYNALSTDGTRQINIMTSDFGVSTSESGTTRYSFTYAVCYEDCKVIESFYKVNVGGNTYEFTESQIQGRKFDMNEITHCSINSQGTLITCVESGVTKYTKLEGNEFTYWGNNYMILGNHIVTNPGHEYTATLVDYSITLDDGITYKYDKAAGVLYREYFGIFGIDTGAGIEIDIDGVTYLMVGADIKLEGATVTTIDLTTNAFVLNGKTYNYIVDASRDYYYAYDKYTVTQDYFKINGVTYTFTGPGSLNVGSRDIVTIRTNKQYHNTYTLYDKYLKGITTTYRDSASGEVNSLTVSNEMIMFSEYITSKVAWNRAQNDTTGTVNAELSNYLNYSVDTKYYQDKKDAYLDTTSPLSGITIYDTGGTVVRYGDGNKLFTYEYGYYNTTALSPTKTYNLRGKVYTVDIANNKVIDHSNGDKEYHVTTTSDPDTNKRYKYVINYVTYYIDEAVENVYWLPAYIETYVGGKDTAKGGSINTVEVPMYDVLNSVLVGNITTDTIGTYRLMNERNTNTALSSGIGSTKYKTGGTANLYDFIYLGIYGKGIYYKDIDYIVSYVDPDDDTLKKVNLNSEFKTCYENYTDAEGNHMITQDCAQEIIANVIKPRGSSREDITYDVYYIIRDKAGNASAVIAKGILYATIYPSTNVIIQNVAASLTNSEIVAVNLGDNTYSITANQGVSTTLLQEAFEINYVKTRTGQNYNNQATMMIYKNDELIANNVAGVNFLEYIDSSEIADYKIVYNMTTTHTPAFGDDIVIHGDEVTLYLSITSPKVDETDDIKINDIFRYESNYIGIVMFIGFILLSALFIAMLILKNKKR